MACREVQSVKPITEWQGCVRIPCTDVLHVSLCKALCMRGNCALSNYLESKDMSKLRWAQN